MGRRAAEGETALLQATGERELGFGRASGGRGDRGRQTREDRAAVEAAQGLVACQRARDSAGPA